MTMKWGGAASFSGAIVTVSQPVRAISNLLPPPLRPASPAPASPGSDRHPVVFILGEMSTGGAHWGGFEFTSGARYREAAVAVPFVAHPAHRGSFVFSYEMFADDRRAVGLGNSFYGLRKRLVNVDWDDEIYRVRAGDRTLLQCAGAVTDEWSSTTALTEKGLDWLRAIFRSPILGRRASGQYVESSFEWTFERSQARPLTADLRWFASALGETVELRSVDGYSFAVRNMRWRTGVPRSLVAA
jgi:hypothetical protein